MLTASRGSGTALPGLLLHEARAAGGMCVTGYAGAQRQREGGRSSGEGERRAWVQHLQGPGGMEGWCPRTAPPKTCH